MIAPLTAPEPIDGRHELDQFDCGERSLNHWLKRRACANQAGGASRTFVTCHGVRVAAYYSLASGAITQQNVPGRFRRNMPEPIPVAVLARLAVDREFQGRGLGCALFRDAAQRVVRAAGSIGIRGIVVHAISEPARDFYLSLGFTPSPLDSMTLLVTLGDVRAALRSG